MSLEDMYVREDICGTLLLSAERLEKSKFFSYKSSIDSATRGISFCNFLDCMRIYNLIIKLKMDNGGTLVSETFGRENLKPLKFEDNIEEHKFNQDENYDERGQFECMIKKLQREITHKVQIRILSYAISNLRKISC